MTKILSAGLQGLRKNLVGRGYLKEGASLTFIRQKESKSDTNHRSKVKDYPSKEFLMKESVCKEG